MAGLQGLVRRRVGLLGRAWERGAVEVGVVAAAGALLVGAVAGQGLANVAVDVADGLTWLPDDSTGQVVQVNPNTGEPQARLQVGGTGSRLQVNQEDGRLLVSDSKTGIVTAVDLSSLLASGRRQGAAGEDGKLLVGGGNVFLADLGEGTVRRVDPVTLDPIGMPWGGGPLADAVVDRAGDVWLMGTDGTLTRARWSQASSRFVVSSETSIDGAGDGTRLVPHERGITIFGPAGGLVRQVGTSRNVVLAMDGMRGNVVAAASSPGDLVAASLPDTGSVVILSRGDAREVALGPLGCEKPQVPTVFEDKVYVPCGGAGRVIVLGPDAQRASEDILTEDRKDPVITVDDGRLVVSAPGAAKGVTVDPSGATRSVTLRDDKKAPVTDVGKPPPPVVLPPVPPVLDPKPSTPPTQPNRGDDEDQQQPTSPPRGGSQGGSQGGPQGGPQGSPGDGNGAGNPPGSGTTTPPPTTGTPPPTPGTGTALQAPTGVKATAAADGTVRVSWTAPTAQVEGYTVEPVGGGVGTTARAGSTSARVSGLAAGSKVSFVVVAKSGTRTATSQASNEVTVATPATAPPGTGTGGTPPAASAPGTPGAVSASATTPDGNGTSVSVSWGAAGGEVSGYELTWSGAASGSAQVGGTSHAFTVPCGGAVCASDTSISFSVVAVGPGGRSGPATGAAGVPATPPPPPPAVDNSVVPSAGGAVVDGVYEDFSEIGSPINAYVGGSWGSHPGSCTLYYSVNGGTQQAVTMSGCGAQTISVGTVTRIAKTYSVFVRSTSVDGTRTSDSAVVEQGVAGAPMCTNSAPVSSQSPRGGSGLVVQPAGIPALPPPCECPGNPNPGGPITQCPIAPVMGTPTDGTDSRYAWASVMFGAAGLLRLVRVRVQRRREVTA